MVSGFSSYLSFFNLYFFLEIKNAQSTNLMQRSNSFAYKILPTAPPQSDNETVNQKRIFNLKNLR